MAIARMAKFIIASHRAEASELLEALQREGICQILNAEEAMVSRDAPELAGEAERPKDIEELIARLDRSIAFLGGYAESQKGLAGVLAPRVVVDERQYSDIVSDKQALEIVDGCEQLQSALDKDRGELESFQGRLAELRPWAALETPVEQIGRFRQTVCLAGLIGVNHFEQVQQQIADSAGAIQRVGTADNSRYACIIVCLKEKTEEVQKLLRSAEYEPVSFAPMTGTVRELMRQHNEKLKATEQDLQQQDDGAKKLAGNLLQLQILHDHYQNLLEREQARGAAPATIHTVLLEGWVRQADYARLEQVVSGFGASSLMPVEPGEGESIPVEIENKNVVRPFEVITRLYGMPQHFEVDPTAFLAPFFALFFGLCLTDAGYALVIIAAMAYLIRKVQGDKKLMWMLGLCSAATLVAGALTGGWFGDAVQQFVPALEPLRKRMMWFDPFEKPMMFFGLSLVLGYVQIQTGIIIAFVHNLKRRQFIAAVCDQLTWLVMLNSIVLFGAGKAGVVSPNIGRVFGVVALVPAAMIFLFSHREGGIAGRLGMGLYNLFSTIFFVGDVLSYLRLMALGMVTAGLAMAINVIAKIAGDIPYGIGYLAMILVLVGGHGFNLAMNALGAFVHTLRLQYVEFFPKFFVGGGRVFEPLSRKYRHIYIRKA